jgi:hypothetical protein
MKITLLLTLVVTGVISSNLPAPSNAMQGKYSVLKKPCMNIFHTGANKIIYKNMAKTHTKDIAAKKTISHTFLSIKLLKPSGQFITFYLFGNPPLCRKPC